MRTFCLLLIAAGSLAFAGVARAVDGPPGVAVYYSPPTSGIYVGSPGIVVLSDGTYLIKCDQFGPNAQEHKTAVTRVLQSKDGGATWSPLAKIDGLFWANIIEHRGAVYMIGTSTEYGMLVCLKSADGGKTWTTPTDDKTGLLRTGKWHTAPVPMVEHDGRLWRAVEDAEGPPGWGLMFRPRMMSIPVDADLLDAGQWTITPPIERDNAWLGGTFKVVLEGNAVFDRQTNSVVNVLRTNYAERAAVARVTDGGRTLVPDPDFVVDGLGGTTKKFVIRWDEQSKQYFALANIVAPADVTMKESGDVRNTLALLASPDLRKWTLNTVLLHHADATKHAFQYPDWLIDGDDLILASRTGYDSPAGLPPRGHDANYLTFHRFKNFRDLTPKDGPQLPQAKTVTRDFGGLRVRGVACEFARLDNGVRAFTNRNYVWQNVPAELKGATITQGSGDFRGVITVEATDGPQTLRVFTAGPAEGVDLSGFTTVPSVRFNYNDGARSAAVVYERELKAGESVKLPTGNFAGVHVIVPAKN